MDMRYASLFLLVVVATTDASAGPVVDVVDVFFLSGQSNASGRVSTGYASDPRDANVKYYYRTDGPAETDATSGGDFTTLQPLATGFYGPEISMGRALVDGGYHPAIIKVSEGSSTLASDWNSQSGGTWWNHWVSDVADALGDLVAMGNSVRLQGFFWIQGENDSLSEIDANNYQTNFENFVVDVSAELTTLGYDSTDLTFVTGLILDQWEYAPTVRAAQQSVMDSSSDNAWFETTDLSNNGQHFTELGVAALGGRFVSTFTATAVPEPSCIALLSVILGMVATAAVWSKRISLGAGDAQ